MTIRIEELKPGDPAEAKPVGTLQVILKVREAGYIPPAVKIRARVDQYLFTGDIEAELLSAVQKDPHVVSVAVNQKLRIIE